MAAAEESRAFSAPVPPTNPRTRHSGSGGATSAPLLSSSLHQHTFDAPSLSSASTHLPSFETKHAGPAALKRIFLGPHVIPSGDKHHKKSKTGSRHSDSDSSSGYEDEDGDDGDEHNPRKLHRHPKQQNGDASGHTYGSAVTSNSAVAAIGAGGNMQKWTGGSFEIGGDTRAAVQRREDAKKRKVSGAATTVVSTAGGGTRWFEAREEPRADGISTLAANGLLGDYALAGPPKHVEDSMPALTHELLRRNSDLPPPVASFVEEDSSSIPGFMSAVTTLKPKGSKLGWGFPLSSSPKPASLLSPTPPTAPELIRSTTSPLLPSPISLPTTRAKGGKGDLPPLPVNEVLARKVDEVNGELVQELDPALGGSTVEERRSVNFPIPSKVVANGRKKRDDILGKERMLGRVEWTHREDLPDSYNEQSARKFKTSQTPWEEFAVVWKPKSIELWTEYAISSTSYFTGHKKLAHQIPLFSPRTRLSLYSSPDLIFCLTHRPSAFSRFAAASSSGGVEAPTSKPSKKRKKTPSDYVHFRHEGTNIYILRPKTSEVAKEWMWGIYKSLGGKGPSWLEVAVPGLGAKIRLKIPQEIAGVGEEGERKFELVTSQKVVEACVGELEKVRDWKDIVRECREEGVELQLAWRRGEVLDWVRKDGEGEWNVVGGWVMTQPYFETVLELRPALHYPTTVRYSATRTSPSRRVSEPPGIEGYITRHKPGAAVERIYLSSHNGHLFICRPSTAFPPDPPLPVYEGLSNPAALVLAPFVVGFASIGRDRKKRQKVWEKVMGRNDPRKDGKGMKWIDEQDGGKGDDDDDDILGKWEKAEHKRLWKQIMSAKGFVDLRDVVKIQRGNKVDGGDDILLKRLEDLGGQNGLDKSEDKVALKKQRSFIITTSGGQEVKFECYSTDVATEWIGRLDALRTYWARRERMDVIEQMEVQTAGATSSTIQATSLPLYDPHRHVDGPSGKLDDDFEASSPLLSKIYNHCILDGCREIIACGRVFLKTGLRGTFRERYLFLLPGTLLEYQLKKRDVYGKPDSRVVYHKRKHTIGLRGCFVYCGRLASALLSPNTATSWDPADAQPQFPRIYGSDGLTSTDHDEDCTLVLFKKKAEMRGLGKEGTVTVFRARSMLERDEWVFALNAAIEKLQRSESERETRLKEFPWLPKA